MTHTYAAHQTTVQWHWGATPEMGGRVTTLELARGCSASLGSTQGWLAQGGRSRPSPGLWRTPSSLAKDTRHTLNCARTPGSTLNCTQPCVASSAEGNAAMCNNEFFRVQMCCCSIYWGWPFQLLQLHETEEHSCWHRHRLCFVMLQYFLETTAYSALISTLIRGAVRMSLYNC